MYLPKKWVDANELKAGNEIKVEEEEDGNLIISIETTKKKKEISIIIEEDYEKNIRFILNELYRQGYDSIKIKVKDKKTIETIQTLVEGLFFEMDIIKKGEDYCTVEMLSEPSFDNYQSILKKLIFLIYDSMDSIDNFAQLEKNTKKYRKYDNFCRRYVNINQKGKENFETNSLLVHLLMIQTDLEKLGKHINDATDNDILAFKKIFQFYESTYKSFLDKDLESLGKLNKQINQFILDNRAQKKCTIFLSQCIEISRILYSAIVPMIGLSLEIKTM